MEAREERKVVFFGCPLDCDEQYDSIQEKLNRAWEPDTPDDPYEAVLAILRQDVPEGRWEELGSLDVPGWLRPKPPEAHRHRIEVGEFIAFMDGDGCREAASRVEDLVRDRILPEIPCLIAVDHSLTGGVFRAVVERYGTENVSLVVLDSHTDAVPTPVLADAVLFDAETNPRSVHDPADPFLYGRTDSYNASSFLHHLVEEGTLDPGNLFLLGVSDYPQKRALKMKDPRIKRYVRAYTELRRKGAKIVTKQECQGGTSRVDKVLRLIRTPYVYVSVDLDIGAGNALDGVRFRNWRGLPEKRIHRIADALYGVLARGVRLAGMDVMEINPRRAGAGRPEGRDPTYRIAARLIEKVAFGLG